MDTYLCSHINAANKHAPAERCSWYHVDSSRQRCGKPRQGVRQSSSDQHIPAAKTHRHTTQDTANKRSWRQERESMNSEN